ncbi:hypothetical protein HYQ45_003578 [Verticillium longisporum]|uniref:Uncharacterized protein n=1 Tax=Verticillium longisporum TaxID=100787 RepID=A0A8I3AV04_VERLO|nr:hypothetical protein HYQ45_003578 [Verticillium longisporum]
MKAEPVFRDTGVARPCGLATYQENPSISSGSHLESRPHTGRATTDAGVVSIIDLATQAKLTNIGIVCTNSENIIAEETKRERPDLADAIQQLIDNIADLKSDIDEANDAADEYDNIDDLSDSDRRQERELRQTVRKLSDQKKSEELKLKTFLIESRNRQVIEQLRSQYGSIMPSGHLEIHCVSNTLYGDKRDKTRDEALPFITISGIPALRRHCIGLVADAQSREVLNYIQKDIPALISELDIWVQNGAGTMDAERRRAIREVVNAVEHGIQSVRPSVLELSLANATFESKVYNDQHVERWVEGAVQASQVWHSWAPSKEDNAKPPT